MPVLESNKTEKCKLAKVELSQDTEVMNSLSQVISDVYAFFVESKEFFVLVKINKNVLLMVLLYYKTVILRLIFFQGSLLECKPLQSENHLAYEQ
ncbi:hypothetical protein BpHYR1_029587 [Brachionus plicatilis]|uniref:Uncharacterized protein n=1 Tax=Brachionus plicatilis TaxID=10195 RepID=A0A3M7SKZ7_BRAPC|nr:hypothetical protein BpHYR1_029587 [Brachionus plicatilis]